MTVGVRVWWLQAAAGNMAASAEVFFSHQTEAFNKVLFLTLFVAI
jgi:hypothetical protein